MLNIEEYISRRKKEDGINEFDVNARTENIKSFVDYVFEYFNNYLNITEDEEKTVLHNEKLDKYRYKLRDYDPEVKEWLVSIYSEYGKHMERQVGNILMANDFFLLSNSDKEFRSFSYDCYSQLIKKCPFLKGQTEMLFLFIKEYHRVKGQVERYSIPYISESINEWASNTWIKHQVNVAAFAFHWVDYFNKSEEIWPTTHKIKSKYTWRKYDYDFRQKSNLFNLDSLYRNMPKKSYTKGKKQELEVLMMYFWLHDFVGSEEDY